MSISTISSYIHLCYIFCDFFTSVGTMLNYTLLQTEDSNGFIHCIYIYRILHEWSLNINLNELSIMKVYLARLLWKKLKLEFQKRLHILQMSTVCTPTEVGKINPA